VWEVEASTAVTRDSSCLRERGGGGGGGSTAVACDRRVSKSVKSSNTCDEKVSSAEVKDAALVARDKKVSKSAGGEVSTEDSTSAMLVFFLKER
jgi:hypothetical protein